MASESRMEVARLWSFLRNVSLLIGEGLVEWKVERRARSEGRWVQLFFEGLLLLPLTNDFVVVAAGVLINEAFWKHFKYILLRC